MVKDWLSHGAGDPQHHFELPLADDDPWPQRPLRVLKTLPDPTRAHDDLGPQTFLNTETPWWDASQLYGGGTAAATRCRGAAESTANYESVPATGSRSGRPGTEPGLRSRLVARAEHDGTVFIREHNAVADALKAAYPSGPTRTCTSAPGSSSPR